MYVEESNCAELHTDVDFSMCTQLRFAYGLLRACTPSNLSDFIHFKSTIYVTISAAACFKLKLLIDICIVLCKIFK